MAPMAAASVGVAQPSMMVPSTAKIRSNGSIIADGRDAELFDAWRLVGSGRQARAVVRAR